MNIVSKNSRFEAEDKAMQSILDDVYVSPPTRVSWSPSRIRAALQCGRKLQGMEEDWQRSPDTIQSIRGRVVHAVLDRWEDQNRPDELREILVGCWQDQIESLGLGSAATWAMTEAVDAVLRIVEADQEIVDRLSGSYKNVRASKAYKTESATLKTAREAAHELAAELDVPPWTSTKGWLVDGVEHSAETVRLGVDYVARLYPNPDIVESEWHLRSTIGDRYQLNGFVDRVELMDDGFEVVDYKSSRYQDTELDSWLQAAAYATLVEAATDEAPKRVRFLYLRGQDSDVYDVDPEWAGNLLGLIQDADRVLRDQAFAPSFAGCGICSYYDVCAGQFTLTRTTNKEEAL